MRLFKYNKALLIAILVVLALPFLWWLFGYRYTSGDAFDEAFLKKTQKALIAEGYIDEGDVLFYVDTAYTSGTFSDVGRTTVFFCFGEDGNNRFFVADAKAKTKGGRIRMASFRAKSLNDYSLEVLNKKGGTYRYEIAYALGDALEADLSFLKSYPEGLTQPILDRAAAAGTFTDTSSVYDYIYQTTSDKEIFKDPLKLAAFFFPFLNDAEPERIKYDEREELVHFTVNGATQDLAFYCYRKLAGGKCLYFPNVAGGDAYEEALKKHEILDHATAAQLDDADPEYREDGDGEGFYTLCSTKDGSATLYGTYEVLPADYRTQNEMGVILRTQDKIMPVYVMWYLSRPESLISGDFDFDGNDEYAFTVQGVDGADTLFIVDPDENGAVSFFSEDDDLVTGKMFAEGTHNYIYNSEDCSLMSRRDPVDLRGPRERTLSLDTMYVSDYPAKEVFFNAENFRITYDGYDFGFAIDGNNMGYDNTLRLRSVLSYKKGLIWHNELHLEKQSVQAASEAEFTYKTYGELETAVLTEALKILVESGIAEHDEELFYTAGSVIAEAPIDRKGVNEGEKLFVSFDDKGIKNIYVAEYVTETNGSAARINSMQVRTLDAYAVSAEDDETRDMIPNGLAWLLRAPLSELRTETEEALEAFLSAATADGNLSENSSVIGLAYERASDKAVFGDPVKFMERFCPSLDLSGCERIKLYEETELVKCGGGRILSFEKIGGCIDGGVIYIPDEGGRWLYEKAVKTHELLDNVTAEDLDLAHKEFPEWDGFSDGGDSVYFVAAEAPDKSAVLYGVFAGEDSGILQAAVLRTKEEIIPVYTDIDYGWTLNFYTGDFDGDGAEEYAFTRNDGHGTGFYQEALYIVDPDLKEPVSYFNNYDDVYYGTDNVFKKVKYEYDEVNSEINIWLDNNGEVSSRVNLAVPGDYWSMWGDDSTFGGIAFGDLFYVRCDKGQLYFIAKGGLTAKDHNIPDYEYSVDLCGDLKYKDGVITYDNLRLDFINSDN